MARPAGAAALAGPVARGEAASALTDPDAAAAAAPLGLLVLLSCVAIWGVNAVFTKIGTRPAGGLDPIVFTGLRFLCVAPCIVALIAWRQPEALRIADRRDLLRYAVYGFISIAFGETMLTVAVHYTSVANMTLLGPGTIPLFTALWAVARREQRLTRAGWVGALVALAGVGLVAGACAGGFRLDAGSFMGDLLALSRSLVHGLYLLFLARTLRERPVATVTVYNIVFGALCLAPYVLWRAPRIHWEQVQGVTWGALAYTVVPTTLYGFLTWNWGMRRVGAVAATNLMYLLPVFGALAAWVILGEPLRFGQIVGGLVIVAGIVVLRWDAMIAGGFLPRVRAIRLPWRR